MKSIKNFFSWLNEQKEESFSSQLFNIVRNQGQKADIRDVRELLHLGADPNYILMGMTDEDFINKVIKAKEEDDDLVVPEMNTFFMSSFAYVIWKRRPDLVSVFLEYGADPDLNISNVNIASGMPTPFMLAIKQYHSYQKDDEMEKILDLLVDAGANINVLDKNGNNGLHIAVDDANFDIIPKLVEMGVDIKRKNNQGKTPYDLIDTWKEYHFNGKHVRGTQIAGMFEEILDPNFKAKS